MAQDRTNSHSSPPFRPRHSPRFTPAFHAEYRAMRKKYRKWPRLSPRNAKGIPAIAPLRKKRFVGRTRRGKREFKRQTLPHVEPTAVESTAVILMMRLERAFTEEIGWARRLLYFNSENARVTVVRRRASGGTERRM